MKCAGVREVHAQRAVIAFGGDVAYSISVPFGARVEEAVKTRARGESELSATIIAISSPVRTRRASLF